MKTKIMTIKQMEQYRKHLFEDEKSKATIDKYMRDIRKLYDFLPESKSISKEAVLMFKQNLQITFKVTSVNSILTAVNSFLIFIGQAQLKMKLIKIQKRIFNNSEKNLTKDEYERLLHAAKAKNERLYILLQTICATGIRVSEHKYITKEALLTGKCIIQNKGKVREVFFQKKLIKKLMIYCKKHAINRGPIFITKNGNPLDRSNIWQDMKQLCIDANVEKDKVYPHNLRHLFAFTFYKIEKDLLRLADLLGHSSIETTRIYTRTSGWECCKLLSKMNLVDLEI